MLNGIQFTVDSAFLGNVMIPITVVAVSVLLITAVTAVLSAKHLRKERERIDKRASDDDAALSSDDRGD